MENESLQGHERPEPDPSETCSLPTGPERGPSRSLPPTARRILETAKVLVERHGYEGLRFDSIARESGINKSMIRYYFGSKAGLVAALVDDLTHDATLQLIDMAQTAGNAADRVAAHLKATRRLMEEPSFKCLFDILPEALRDPQLGSLVAALYEWYREVNVTSFGGADADPRDPELLALASVFMALIDGLVIQVALGGSNFNRDRAWALVERMVVAFLEEREPGADIAQPGG